ncbi:hypothetical protein F4776DRAFT_669871 [Hypoxylon sp. NC0597]|nr:hypothetical protein F4776DRAFT_669871 [Hypoxylon sp. NC0597]
MADQHPLSSFEKLATELIVDVFCQLETASDVHSLLLTSKALYATYAGSENYIAKTRILRLLPPDDYKLAVMAIESRKVDRLRQESIQGFFDDYLNPYCEEWDLRLFRMYTVFHLPELISATSVLVRDLDSIYLWSRRYRSMVTESPTEFARKVRSYYIREIAINLFHREPGHDSVFSCAFNTPYESMAIKYWKSFSPGEIDQALGIDINLARQLKDLRWRNTEGQGRGDGPEFLGGGEIPKESVDLVCHPYEGGVKFFFKLAPIREIYRWRCPTMSGPRSKLDEHLKSVEEHLKSTEEHVQPIWSWFDAAYISFRGEVDRPSLIAKQFGNPRFHPDPESISDDAWHMDMNRWAEHEHIRFPCAWYAFMQSRMFWDQATLEKFRETTRRYNPA